MTSSDYTIDPDDLRPLCPKCKTRDDVEPIDGDHPVLRWLHSCGLAFRGTKAESQHPQLRPVPTFCDDGSCDRGFVDTPSGAVSRCPKCNADPIGAVG